MWEFLDKIIYINLDEREDRREIMSSFFEKGQIPSDKIQRFSAIKHEIGAVGASLSHIAVLKLAKTSGWKNILILEDDVEWVESKYDEIENLMKQSWDVFMLGGSYVEQEGIKIKYAYSAYSYIVREHYYDKLLHNFEEGLKLKLDKKSIGISKQIRDRIYKELVNKDVFHSFDSYWMKLQIKDNWIGILACKHVHTFSNVSNTINYPIIDGFINTEHFKTWFSGVKHRLEK